MTCANIDEVSTAMNSSWSDAISLPKGILDHLLRGRFRGPHDPILASSLGFVERRIGGGEQLAGLGPAGARRDPEARSHADLGAVREPDLTLRERGTRAFGKPHAAVRVGAGQHERELLAAPAAGGVAFAHRVPERVRERLQHLVAGCVPEAVVDALEV